MASGLLLLVSLVVSALTDRPLFVFWGRSPWITDTVLHHRHRPGVQHTFEYWYKGHQSTLSAGSRYGDRAHQLLWVA